MVRQGTNRECEAFLLDGAVSGGVEEGVIRGGGGRRTFLCSPKPHTRFSSSSSRSLLRETSWYCCWTNMVLSWNGCVMCLWIRKMRDELWTWSMETTRLVNDG